jgi:YaiO family outer membrane protein
MFLRPGRRWNRPWNGLLLAAVFAFIVAPGRAQEDPVATARHLAFSGEREKAKELLIQRLATVPSDTDARTLYGTILSWQSQYDEARKQLEQVLEGSPGNGDAMQALANVELWTGHPDKAEALLSQLIRERPDDKDILYARSRALSGLHRDSEAKAALSHLLEIDPLNRDARNLLDSLGAGVELWQASVLETGEWFSGGIGDRAETQLALRRQTGVGPFLGRYSVAQSFGLVSNQLELEFYPTLRKGTYAFLNVGYSPDANLYPRYRMASDLYQALGKGFEATIGYRRLGFDPAVNIYTTALSKYQGNWLFTARGYFTPGITYTSQSVQLSARRYFGDSVSYLEFRYGHGSVPLEVRSSIDLGVLDSSTYDASFTRVIARRWRANGEFGISREDRVYQRNVEHYVASLGGIFLF